MSTPSTAPANLGTAADEKNPDRADLGSGKNVQIWRRNSIGCNDLRRVFRTTVNFHLRVEGEGSWNTRHASFVTRHEEGRGGWSGGGKARLGGPHPSASLRAGPSPLPQGEGGERRAA